jgi:hypothetical protein
MTQLVTQTIANANAKSHNETFISAMPPNSE